MIIENGGLGKYLTTTESEGVLIYKVATASPTNGTTVCGGEPTVDRTITSQIMVQRKGVTFGKCRSEKYFTAMDGCVRVESFREFMWQFRQDILSKGMTDIESDYNNGTKQQSSCVITRALCVLLHSVGLNKKYFAAMNGCVGAAASYYGKSKNELTTRQCRVLN